MGTLKSRRLFIDGLTALRNDSVISKKDLEVLEDRITREGDYIVMHLLPKFAKNLELSLELGFLQPIDNFNKLKGTNITCLFKEMLLKIFDISGQILSAPCPTSIANIRQACYLFHKVVAPFTQDDEDAAWEKYIQLDSELPLTLSHLSIRALTVLEYSKNFMHKWLKDLDLKEIKPSHGPGASATGLSQAERRKRSNLIFYGGLHERYPYYTWHFSNASDLLLNVAAYWAAKRNEVKPASKLCLVPKDARGPRIICIEPPEFMWVQKGQMAKMYDYCEKHPLSIGRVNFTDQSINQKLAKENSLTRDLASIDLKDASDRVSLTLVKHLIPPHILPYLLASRTGCTKYRDSRVELRKYASMGNATTFPVEAIVFYALLNGIKRYLHCKQPCYVYGDDIFFDSNHLFFIIDVFNELGLRVNIEKSFAHGFFRESCGKDFYNGFDVTPTRIRRLENDIQTSISISESADLFFERGLWATSLWLDDLSRKISSIGFISSPDDSLVGIKKQIFSKSAALYFDSKPVRKRFNKNYQVTEVRVKVFKSLVATESLENESDMLFQKLTNGWQRGHNIPDSVHFPNRGMHKVGYTWLQSDEAILP